MMRFVFLCIISLPLFALVESGDSYEQIQTTQQDVIFEKSSQEYNSTKTATHFLQSAAALHQEYRKSFGFTLSLKNYTILASQNNQIANGMASFYPLLKNEFYTAGASMSDYFSATSWLKQLSIHELAHTYALDAKQNFSLALQKVFGNNGAWFINPNYLLPTLLLEGNAVMNESRFDIGGRLFSGVHRALVYVLAKQKALNYSRLLNNHLYFPFRSEKYLVGGYFWSYLVERFGIDKANRFFLAHSKHYINPLRINTSFKEHFGFSFKELIKAFLESLQKHAQPMQLLKGETLKTVSFIAPLNRIGHEIVWLDSSTVGPNRLNRFTANRLEQKKSNLALGKVFKIKKHYLSSATLRDSATSIHAGLFDTHRHSVPSSKNFYFYDIRAHHTAKAYIPDSYEDIALYKDNSFISKSHSEAILDKKGHIYYAKQNGNTRTIYKERKPLFSFKGYFCKLLELRNGILYFIASTPYGASLFSFDGSKLNRLSQADNIVDARMLEGNRFLAVSVEADGYHIIKASIDKKVLQNPTLYTYSFGSKTLPSLEIKPPKATPYTPFEALKFATFSPFFYSNTLQKSLDYSIQAFFTDPMQRNSLNLLAYDLYGTQAQMLQYRNQAYRLNYTASLMTTQYNNQNLISGALWLDYDLYKLSQEALHLTTGLQNSQYQPQNGFMLAKLSYTNFRHYALSYDYHRFFALSAAFQAGQSGTYAQAELHYTQELLSQLFFKFNQTLAYADVPMSTAAQGANVLKDLSLISFNDPTLNLNTPYYSKSTLQLERPFFAQYYLDTIPLGLRRLNAILGGSYWALQHLSFSNSFVGLEAELLGAHLLPFKLRVLYNSNSYTQNRFYTFRLGVSF